MKEKYLNNFKGYKSVNMWVNLIWLMAFINNNNVLQGLKYKDKINDNSSI